jgi:hypothetical protein
VELHFLFLPRVLYFEVSIGDYELGDYELVFRLTVVGSVDLGISLINVLLRGKVNKRRCHKMGELLKNPLTAAVPAPSMVPGIVADIIVALSLSLWLTLSCSEGSSMNDAAISRGL